MKKIMGLFILALIIGLFAGASYAAHATANNASNLAATINSFDHGGTGTLIATVSGFDIKAPIAKIGNTVTVTGKVKNARNELQLIIDTGVTVI